MLESKGALRQDKQQLTSSGCKESQFYSLPFGQAVASTYWPKSHFKQPPKNQSAQQAFPREFVENIWTRAKKKRNDGGGGGERRKLLPADLTILKNCIRPRTQLLIGAVLVVFITQHSKLQSNQVCFVYVRHRSGLMLFVVTDCKCFCLIFT